LRCACKIEPGDASRDPVVSIGTIGTVEPLRPRGTGPALFLNPADDLAFVGEVDRLMDDGVAEAAELERRLRDSFPSAVVRPRDLSNEPFVVWYVYRDGRWVASD
jgi:hypothetical protein